MVLSEDDLQYASGIQHDGAPAKKRLVSLSG